MSSTSKAEALSDDLLEGQEHLDDASVDTKQCTKEVPGEGKTQVTHSLTGNDACEEQVCISGHSEIDVSDKGKQLIVKGAEDGQETKTKETPEASVYENIAGEVASAFVELGGVGNELKTAFKDAQSEFLSAVCEVKSELSHVLGNSSRVSSGVSELAGKDFDSGERDSEGNIISVKVESMSSDDTCNFKKVVVSHSVDSESVEESYVSETKKSVKLVVDEFEDDEVRVCSEHLMDTSQPQPTKMNNMDVNIECSRLISSTSVNICSNVLAKNDEKTNNNISMGEEVTEDLFKDVRIVDSDEERHVGTERGNHFDESKVISVQRRQVEYHLCEREQTGKMLSIDNDGKGLKAQPLSAPSTPVPSASNSARKILRSQGCRARRVSFPEDETHLISSYLEPVNPWQQMAGVTVEEIAAAYRSSCERHRTQPLPGVLQQIKALPLAIAGRVECLSLRGQKLEGGQCEGLEEIFRRVQFKILDLEGCSLDDDTAIPLFDMIEFYDSATQLNISCNGKIGFRGWQACSRMLKRTPSVEYLDARNTNLNETNMPILGRALRLGARLHTLHLENCNLTGRPLIMLTAALRQNDTLAELYLAENRLGVNDCIQLGNLVRANSTLRLLDLRNNNVQDAGCGHVCEGIAEQQKLQQQQQTETNVSTNKKGCMGLHSLILWSNHLTQQSASHLAGMLTVTKTLETLNLGRNNLTSEGILRLKESLLRNHALLRLGLQAARIADEGAVALAEYTADNMAIQHIDLRENPIRVAGLMALAHSLRLNSTIIQMDIDSDPRSEPAAELAEQHFTLQKDIKEYCQRNLTRSHLRASEEQAKENNQGCPQVKSPNEGLCLSGAIRKISLTCETTPNKAFVVDKIEGPNRGEEEKQKYTSPAPSPLPSPSPSPCASPSPSPVPSPLKNRFRVFRVNEAAKSSPELISGCSQTTILCSSVPVSQSGRSMSAGDLSLPPKQNSMRPSRASTGGRFTVTRVAEPSGSQSLPSEQGKVTCMSGTSFTCTNSASGPKIVISSPVRVERGFSVEETSPSSVVMERVGDKENKCELDKSVGCKSVGLPEDQSRLPQRPLSGHVVRLKSDGDSDDVFVDAVSLKTSSSECQRRELVSQRNMAVYKPSQVESHKSDKDSDSLSSSDLTDSGFLDEGVCSRGGGSPSPSPSSPHPEGDRDSLLSSSVDSTSQEDTSLGLSVDNSTMQSSLPSIPLLPCTLQQTDLLPLNEPPKRAPLAAMENGSFDSDSEDSELTTQSSDSTHSDEIRITTEQYEPRPAWGSKQEPAEVTINSKALTSSGSPGTG
ncbi:protein phosphatase 1 regulatory subunit 37-like [Homarus americanus]|uniref:Phosphatase 1 regulatory subunit 37-like n=1 Tax=Homarus americanus TaxID=6706 RepID=A0A8J5JYG0_HOMAM|nr:protein phosphatase 1 regulatory subunit 37-like [Homarus americanus]XP_042226919.1 protein phosphatase 1 regulatory subunit 37-like [Homarus americanus]KAG7166182.1 phosphatase 1 regulatory subunit 37-like [Homarus americanus]